MTKVDWIFCAKVRITDCEEYLKWFKRQTSSEGEYLNWAYKAKQSERTIEFLKEGIKLIGFDVIDFQ